MRTDSSCLPLAMERPLFLEALVPFRTEVGGYRQRNRFRFVIAAA